MRLSNTPLKLRFSGAGCFACVAVAAALAAVLFGSGELRAAPTVANKSLAAPSSAASSSATLGSSPAVEAYAEKSQAADGESGDSGFFGLLGFEGPQPSDDTALAPAEPGAREVIEQVQRSSQPRVSKTSATPKRATPATR